MHLRELNSDSRHDRDYSENDERRLTITVASKPPTNPDKDSAPTCSA